MFPLMSWKPRTMSWLPWPSTSYPVTRTLEKYFPASSFTERTTFQAFDPAGVNTETLHAAALPAGRLSTIQSSGPPAAGTSAHDAPHPGSAKVEQSDGSPVREVDVGGGMRNAPCA